MHKHSHTQITLLAQVDVRRLVCERIEYTCLEWRPMKVLTSSSSSSSPFQKTLLALRMRSPSKPKPGLPIPPGHPSCCDCWVGGYFSTQKPPNHHVERVQLIETHQNQTKHYRQRPKSHLGLQIGHRESVQKLLALRRTHSFPRFPVWTNHHWQNFVPVPPLGHLCIDIECLRCSCKCSISMRRGITAAPEF